MSLTDQIYMELMDGMGKGLDWQQVQAKYSASKGPLYNALGRVVTEGEAKIRALSEEKTKVQEEVNQTGLTLDSLDQKINEAESSLAPLEEMKNDLNEGIETLETKLTEKANLLKHAGELEKLGFGIERLRQLREALTEIGAKNGLKSKEAVSKFFDDLKDYEAVLETESLLQGLQTQIETNKLQAENWQAKEETLRRKHDDRTEAIDAMQAILKRGVKAEQVISWNGIVSKLGGPEELEKELGDYKTIRELLNAGKEEAAACQLRLTQVQSQVKTLEKDRAKIEAAIDALKVAGVKELKAMTEATEKQLKAVAASEIKEVQDAAREIRSEFATFVTQLDALAEKLFELGQEFGKIKKGGLQKYEGVKDALESHAVASETANEHISK